ARAMGAGRLPSSIVVVEGSRRARARFGARYGVLLAQDVRRRLVERVRGGVSARARGEHEQRH
ncbi:MAG: hypothetical protein ACXVFL_03540, partial [Solirubrobacteraceae bacterium]